MSIKLGSSGNDFIHINNHDDHLVYDGGAGHDFYIISPDLNRNIRITDTAGTNTINFPNGIAIKSVAFSSVGAQFTLANDSKVAINSKTAYKLVFVFGDIDPTSPKPFANTQAKSFNETAIFFGADPDKFGETPIAGTKSGVIDVSMQARLVKKAIAR